MSRIQEIQRIASAAPGVERVDIMQAGREVRVIVAGQEQGDIPTNERRGSSVLGDEALYPLAQEIAREIEEQVTFAGQIRVTVIRESRAVTVAR